MFVGNEKKVMDTMIDDCTQKKIAKSTNFFTWVYLSEFSYFVRPLLFLFDLKLKALREAAH